MIFTFSDIDNFLTCRRLWTWNYVHDFHPPETKHGPRNLGTRVHKTLEHLYSGKEADPVAYFNALSAKDIAWQEESGSAPWEIDALYKETVIGRRLIEKYVEWREESGADDGLEVVSTEEVIEAPILGGDVLLKGKIDVKFRNVHSGFLLLNDFKTVGRLDSGTRAGLEHSYQHHVYMSIESLAHPDEPMPRATNTLLVKGRYPEIHRFPIPGTAIATPNRLRKIEAICIEMMRSIDEEIDYPSPGKHCAWCDYRKPCLIADDNEDSAMEYLRVKFVTGGKHDRYDSEVEMDMT
jgi:PD-(D/E)XK nuclease superfamily